VSVRCNILTENHFQNTPSLRQLLAMAASPRTPIPKRKHVGLIGMARYGMDGRILRGILQYRLTTIPWLLMEGGHSNSFLEELLENRLDGLIGRIDDPALLERLQQREIPLVHLSGEEWIRDSSGIWLDHEAVGRMMARYYCEAAYSSLLFATAADAYYERERWRGFHLEASRLGMPSLWYRSDIRELETQDGRRIPRPRFLKDLMPTLRKPTGVACSSDRYALDFIRTLQVSRQRIPEEIAVLGTGNDTSLCEIVYPPLSSVDLPGEQIGYEAAMLLDRLMSGDALPEQARMIGPSGIVERQSTSPIPLHDHQVAQAVSLMRENLSPLLTIQDLAELCGCSRKTLERKFQQALQKSPGQQYRELRLEHARRLLRETRLRIQEVAQHCGYGKADVFSKEFRRSSGLAPSEFRKEYGQYP